MATSPMMKVTLTNLKKEESVRSTRRSHSMFLIVTKNHIMLRIKSINSSGASKLVTLRLAVRLSKQVFNKHLPIDRECHRKVQI